MVVQVHGGHTGRQDVNDSHCHDLPVQPILLVEGAVTHLWTIRTVFRLGQIQRERKQKDILYKVCGTKTRKLCVYQERYFTLNQFSCVSVHLDANASVQWWILNSEPPCLASHMMCGCVQ